MGSGPFNPKLPNARIPVLQEDGSMTLPWRLWAQTLGPPTTNIGVISLNGLGGVLNLVAGADVSISASGSDITISASGSSASGFLKASGSPINNALAVFTSSTTLSTMDLSGDVSTAGSTVTTFSPITANYLIANATGSTASPTGVGLSAFLDSALDNTQGDILYRNATEWTYLGPGTAGQVLQTGGPAANPSWVSGASGSVTSVALADGSTTPIFNITGSPVTSSGTLTETLKTQNANKVFAGPSSGSAAQPTFRSLVAADLPTGLGSWIPLVTGDDPVVLVSDGEGALIVVAYH